MGERAKVILNEYSAKKLLMRDTLDLDKFYTADLKLFVEVARKEIERLNEKIDTLKIEISSLMSRYFYEEDFYIEDTHLDKLLRIIDNDIVLRGSDKE